MKQQRKRFTLIEILVVIVIIAILAGVVVGVRGMADRKAMEVKNRSIMTKIEHALERHREDYGWYPVRQTAGALDFSNIQTGSASGTFQDPNGINYLGEFVTTQTQGGGWSYIDGSWVWIDGGEVDMLEIWDAYGEQFRYQSPGTNNPQSYDLWSAGNDGLNGTDDDITNWSR